jgi:hypothetical protein
MMDGNMMFGTPRFAATATALLAFAMAACSDHTPTGAVKAAARPAAHDGSGPTPAEWKGYWRNDTTLWVYDMTPEVGVHTWFDSLADHAAIRALGIRLVRKPTTWRDETACPGCFGSVIDVAREKGTKLLAIVPIASRDDAMQATNPSNAADRDAYATQFASFMAGEVARYPDVAFWQIGNEPDAGCENAKFLNGQTTWSGQTASSSYSTPNRYAQGRNYADLLRRVYPAMKSAAHAQGREVWIVTAGFTGTEVVSTTSGCVAVPGAGTSWNFVQGMYDNGGRELFDIIALHTYGVTAQDMETRLSDFNYRMHTAWGDPNRPLWITEFGNSAANSAPGLSPSRDMSRDPFVFDSLQAQWYQEAVGIQRAAPVVQKMFAYTLRTDDGGTVPGSGIAGLDPWSFGLGIQRHDGSPRPSYSYLQSIAGQLQAAENRGTFTSSFSIVTSGQIPADHPFHYSGTTIVVDNVAVNTLYPTPVAMRWRTALHRKGWTGGDHLYTTDANEASGTYTLEDGAGHPYYFATNTRAGTGWAPLYRCYASGHHYESRSSTCEASVVPEGQHGYVATTQLPGTVPLYRRRNVYSGDSFVTIDPAEAQGVLAYNYVDEGILGYVWPYAY